MLRELALARRGPVLGRGRRLRGRGGPLLRLDARPRSTPSLGAELGAVAVDWYGVTERGQLRGAQHPAPPARRRRWRARPRSKRPGAACSRRARTRVRPGLDDKVLTEWNAMFGVGAGRGGRRPPGATTGPTPRWRIGEFLLAQLRRADDGRWLRSWQDGRGPAPRLRRRLRLARRAFTRLAELTGRRPVARRRPRETAARHARALRRRRAALLFTTGHDAERWSSGPWTSSTAPSPSANAVAAAALLRLGALTGDEELTDAGESLLGALRRGRRRASAGLSPTPWPRCRLAGGGITEVVVTGDRPDLLAAARARYEPTVVLAWGEPHASPLWDGRARRVRLRVPALRLPGPGRQPRRARPGGSTSELAAGRAAASAAPMTAPRRELGASGHPRATATAPAHRGRGRKAPARPGPRHAPVHGARLHRRGHHRRRPRHAAPLVRLRIDWGERPRARPRRPSTSSTPCGPTTPSATTWPSPRPSPWPASPTALGTVPGPAGAAGAARPGRLPPSSTCSASPGRRRRTGSSAACGRRWRVVVPSRGPVLFRRREDDTVWARFGWPRSDNWLPVEDRRAIAALGAAAARPAVGQGPRRRARLPAPLPRGGAQPAARRPLLQDGGGAAAPTLRSRPRRDDGGASARARPCRRPGDPRPGPRPWPTRRRPGGRRA